MLDALPQFLNGNGSGTILHDVGKSDQTFSTGVAYVMFLFCSLIYNESIGCFDRSTQQKVGDRDELGNP